MAKLTLMSLGSQLKEKRGSRGIRDVANEIGVSSATLSRVENGKLPDIKTFSKICRWLKVDPSELLGCTIETEKAIEIQQTPTVTAHLRADRNLSPEAVNALAEMILRAQSMIENKIR